MSKSRSDRGKTPAQVPIPQTIVLNEVIPGRLTENDWGLMVDDETTEDFVEDILHDVVEHALDTIYQKILDSRLIPYAVDSARVMLLELVEYLLSLLKADLDGKYNTIPGVDWQFLERDDGEVNQDCDPSWLEEEEPKPGIIDSWAQGAVPVLIEKEPLESHDYLKEEDGEESIQSDENKDTVDESIESRAVSSQSDRLHSPKDNEGIENEDNNEEITRDSIEVTHRKETFIKSQSQEPHPPLSRGQHSKLGSKQASRYRGKVPDFRPITLTPVTDDKVTKNEWSESRLTTNPLEDNIKQQYGRPPGMKEVTFDEKGNVIMVQKLRVEKLPSHRIKTQYTIVDPAEEVMKAKLSNKKQRYTMLRQSQATQFGPPPTLLSDQKRMVPGGSKTGFHASTLPTPLVDLMNVSKGVSVNEGGILKKSGTKAKPRQESALGRLQPMASEAYGLTLTPRDIVNEGSPVVRQLELKRAPLPSIAPSNATSA